MGETPKEHWAVAASYLPGTGRRANIYDRLVPSGGVTHDETHERAVGRAGRFGRDEDQRHHVVVGVELVGNLLILCVLDDWVDEHRTSPFLMEPVCQRIREIADTCDAVCGEPVFRAADRAKAGRAGGDVDKR